MKTSTIALLIFLFPLQFAAAEGIITPPDTPDGGIITAVDMAQINQNNQKIAESLAKLATSLKKVKKVYADLDQRIEKTEEMISCQALIEMRKDIDAVKSEMQKMRQLKTDTKDLKIYAQYEKDLKLYTTSYENYQKTLKKINLTC